MAPVSSASAPSSRSGQAGLVHRLTRRHEGELGRPVVASLLLAVEDGARVEGLDLAGDLARDVARDRTTRSADAGLAGHEPRPEGPRVVAQRRHARPCP